MKRIELRRAVLLVTTVITASFFLVTVSCGDDEQPPPPAKPKAKKAPSTAKTKTPPAKTPASKEAKSESKKAKTQTLPAGTKKPTPPKRAKGLTITVIDAIDAPATSTTKGKTAKSKALSDEDKKTVLKRLPTLKAGADDRKDFAFRPRSKPAPRKGKTVKGSFPSTKTAKKPDVDPNAAAKKKELTVLRFSPEGEIPLAPNLSVTFSQPMIPVTAHKELGKKAPPVRLWPKVAGKWRWIGTRSLVFEPKGRFAMATVFKVTIPAGTTAMSGARLKKAVTWEFKTPPLKVTSSHPTSGPQGLKPIVLVHFNQKINAEDDLSYMDMRAAGSSRGSVLKRATSAELAANPNMKYLAKSKENDRWIAVRPEKPLPADSRIIVTVAKGTPSAEGPRSMVKTHSFGFRTYGALTLKKARCGWGKVCRPLHPIVFEFSNPLDAKAFQSDQVQVSPVIKGMRSSVSGRYLYIRGIKKGRTTYKVTIAGGLHDAFNQTLGKPITRSFDVGPAGKRFWWNSQDFIVLDPAGKPLLPVYSINYTHLNVSLYKVGPGDWRKYQRFAANANSRKRAVPAPGKRVFNKRIAIKKKNDERVETWIDLAPALTKGVGQVVMVVEPEGQPDSKWYRQVAVAWISRTQIGLDAFTDNEQLIGWASSLKSGKPLEGVSISIFPDNITAQTAANGIAKMPLPSGGGGPRTLVAKKGADIAILPETFSRWQSDSN